MPTQNYRPNTYAKPCCYCKTMVAEGAGFTKKVEFPDKQTGEIVSVWVVFCASYDQCQINKGGAAPAPRKQFPTSPQDGKDPGISNRYAGRCSNCSAETAVGAGWYRYKKMLCQACDFAAYPDQQSGATLAAKKQQEDEAMNQIGVDDIPF